MHLLLQKHLQQVPVKKFQCPMKRHRSPEDQRPCKKVKIGTPSVQRSTPLLKNLTHLNLSKCYSITDNGLSHINPLVNLTYLNLQGCEEITDNGLSHINPLVNLKENLKDTQSKKLNHL